MIASEYPIYRMIRSICGGMGPDWLVQRYFPLPKYWVVKNWLAEEAWFKHSQASRLLQRRTVIIDIRASESGGTKDLNETNQSQ